MKFKSYRFFKKDLQTLVLALRFAIQYETEFIAAYDHMKDKESKETVKKSKELIGKFIKLKKKIQPFILGDKNDK